MVRSVPHFSSSYPRWPIASTSCSNPTCPKPSTDSPSSSVRLHSYSGKKVAASCFRVIVTETVVSTQYRLHRADWPEHKSNDDTKNIDKILIGSMLSTRRRFKAIVYGCLGCGVEFAEDDLDETTTTKKNVSEEVCDMWCVHCLITGYLGWKCIFYQVIWLVSRAHFPSPRFCHQFILFESRSPGPLYRELLLPQLDFGRRRWDNLYLLFLAFI